jgi:AraC-like DNA-binding protein
VSLSPCYFSRMFKQTVGTDFRTFVNEIRIERAERLMLDETMSIADIALECGFENIRTFNRAFQVIRKSTPTEIRGRLI